MPFFVAKSDSNDQGPFLGFISSHHRSHFEGILVVTSVCSPPPPCDIDTAHLLATNTSESPGSDLYISSQCDGASYIRPSSSSSLELIQKLPSTTFQGAHLDFATGHTVVSSRRTTTRGISTSVDLTQSAHGFISLIANTLTRPRHALTSLACTRPQLHSFVSLRGQRHAMATKTAHTHPRRVIHRHRMA